jgi:hypothetical protein
VEYPNEQAVADLPIAKLHRDLLWQIFALNLVIEKHIHTDDDRGPLKTACHTSQVCASWRQVIISSSSLWSNIIDLESSESVREHCIPYSSQYHLRIPCGIL